MSHFDLHKLLKVVCNQATNLLDSLIDNFNFTRYLLINFIDRHSQITAGEFIVFQLLCSVAVVYQRPANTVVIQWGRQDFFGRGTLRLQDDDAPPRGSGCGSPPMVTKFKLLK